MDCCDVCCIRNAEFFPAVWKSSIGKQWDSTHGMFVKFLCSKCYSELECKTSIDILNRLEFQHV